MKAYVGYLTRTQYMLRRGKFVADVLLYEGEDAPNYGDRGRVPEGWRGDHCSKSGFDALTRDGEAYVSPGGMRYRVVACPGDDVARKLAAIGCEKDFVCADPNVSWIHRRDGSDEIYFVATASEKPCTVTCSFRDSEGEPELWNPERGEIRAAACRRVGGRAEMDLAFGPVDSVFVVFRKKPTAGIRPTCAYKDVRSVGVDGPWKVSFRAPGETVPSVFADFPSLVDWTSRDEEVIRYFSGTATYETKMDVPQRAQDERLILDLGEVRDIAEVSVNGRDLPVLWKPPFMVDVTDVLPAGCAARITLMVKVTNRWPNRLIGDERQFKDDAEWKVDKWWNLFLLKSVPAWVQDGKPSPTGRKAFSLCKLWKAGDELLPSGLLGPVRLIVCRRLCRDS